MNRRFRRFLLVVSTAAFIVIAPLVVLYALGFRLTSERVGVLVLDSIPSRAQVVVDGESVGTTPRTISGLGETSVKVLVQKDGYTAWEKQLSLTTGLTSEINSILLLPEAMPSRVLAQGASQFSLAPNRTLLATVTAGSLTIYDENQRVITPPRTLPAPPVSLLWSPDSTSLLISYSVSRQDILSLQDNTLHPLPSLSLASLDAAAWDARQPGRLLALTASGELLALQVGENTRESIASSVAAFAPGPRSLFVATPRNLVRMNLEGLPQLDSQTPLGKGVKKIIVSPAGHAVIWFQDDSVSLWEDRELTPIVGSAQSLGFSPSGELLYLQTAPQELMVINIGDERLLHIPLRRPYLVTRISSPITHPQWFAGSQHLVYQVGDQIVLTEIDTRDHAVSNVIDSTNLTNAQVAVGEDGNTLFYLKRDPAGTTSLVRADLIL